MRVLIFLKNALSKSTSLKPHLQKNFLHLTFQPHFHSLTSQPHSKKEIFIFLPPNPIRRKKFLLLKKQISDLSPQTFNPSHYRNNSLKLNTHPTAFGGIYFFKSNKFFLSALPKKNFFLPPLTSLGERNFYF